MTRNIKYKCLVLDHDNTIVKSVPDNEYPAMLYALKKLKIDICLSENEYITKHLGGIGRYIKKELGLNSTLQHELFVAFYDYINANPPKLYSGISHTLSRYVELGGVVVVVSKSPLKYIKRDYIANNLPSPAMIFSLEEAKQHNKPNIYPLEQISIELGFQKEDMFLLDDGKDGLEMAKRFKIAHGVAGWGVTTSQSLKALKGAYVSSVCFDEISDFYDFMFCDK